MEADTVAAEKKRVATSAHRERDSSGWRWVCGGGGGTLNYEDQQRRVVREVGERGFPPPCHYCPWRRRAEQQVPMCYVFPGRHCGAALCAGIWICQGLVCPAFQTDEIVPACPSICVKAPFYLANIALNFSWARSNCVVRSRACFPLNIRLKERIYAAVIAKSHYSHKGLLSLSKALPTLKLSQNPEPKKKFFFKS